MVQDLDVLEMQQCIIIQSASSCAMMVILGLGLKQGDVSTMKLGVDKTSLVNVCKTNIAMSQLLIIGCRDRYHKIMDRI